MTMVEGRRGRRASAGAELSSRSTLTSGCSATDPTGLDLRPPRKPSRSGHQTLQTSRSSRAHVVSWFIDISASFLGANALVPWAFPTWRSKISSTLPIRARASHDSVVGSRGCGAERDEHLGSGTNTPTNDGWVEQMREEAEAACRRGKTSVTSMRRLGLQKGSE